MIRKIIAYLLGLISAPFAAAYRAYVKAADKQKQEQEQADQDRISGAVQEALKKHGIEPEIHDWGPEEQEEEPETTGGAMIGPPPEAGG